MPTSPSVIIPVVTEEDAAAIRADFEHDGEEAAALELRPSAVSRAWRRRDRAGMGADHCRLEGGGRDIAVRAVAARRTG